MSSQISGWRSQQPGILKKTWIEPEFSILAFHLNNKSGTRGSLFNDQNGPNEPHGRNTSISEQAKKLAEGFGSFKL